MAAAHASCYAMALANVLHEGGNDPEELRINATCVLDMGSLKITSEVLDVTGRVPASTPTASSRPWSRPTKSAPSPTPCAAAPTSR
jgi:organic hydroperoxide reductase OsmC/OhrA